MAFFWPSGGGWNAHWAVNLVDFLVVLAIFISIESSTSFYTQIPVFVDLTEIRLAPWVESASSQVWAILTLGFWFNRLQVFYLYCVFDLSSFYLRTTPPTPIWVCALLGVWCCFIVLISFGVASLPLDLCILDLNFG